MENEFRKINYDYGLGYRILHTSGDHAGESTLTYPHYSLGFMLIYYRHGTGNIKIEGRHYDINEGDVIILDPSELFQFSVDDKSYHERIVVVVNESMFKDFPYDCSSLFYPFCKREKSIGNRIPAEKVKEHGIDRILVELLGYLKASESSNKILAFCKVTELLDIIGKTINQDDINVQIPVNPLINDVLDYLNQNFNDEISVESVASEFSIDKSYLSHLFKENVGMSLWTYVILRRIQLFNQKIRKNDSIEETCYQVGFRNYSNFFRLYKKYMNMTPAQFKRQLKK